MAQAKIRRIDFSPGDWIGGTLGMTLEEEGLYVRLVARTYSFGASLDDDPKALAKLCQVRPQVIRRILSRLKLMGKFHETGGKLVSNRCETEMKLARNRLEQARFNGAKGGRPNGLEEPDGPPSVKAHARVTSTTKVVSKEPLGSSEPKAADAAPAPSLKKQVYDLGKRRLGSGAQVTRLIEAHDGDLSATLFTLQRDVGDAKDYCAKIIRNEAEPETDWDAVYRELGVS